MLRSQCSQHENATDGDFPPPIHLQFAYARIRHREYYDVAKNVGDGEPEQQVGLIRAVHVGRLSIPQCLRMCSTQEDLSKPEG